MPGVRSWKHTASGVRSWKHTASKAQRVVVGQTWVISSMHSDNCCYPVGASDYGETEK